MITRHFYRLDEVELALIHCIVKKRINEAMFWAQEVVDSGLGGVCMNLLWKTWITFFGIGALSWFDAAIEIWKKDELDEEDIYYLAYALVSLPNEARNCTHFVLLGLGLRDYSKKPYAMPDRICRLATCKLATCKLATCKLATLLQAAIKQGKAELAWASLRDNFDWTALLDCVEDEDSALLQRLFILQTLPATLGCEEYIWATRALATCLILYPRNKLYTLRTDRPPLYSNLGCRARRVYEIPRIALPFLCRRGLQSCYVSNLKEIRGIKNFINSSVPCWEELLEPYTSFKEIQDDTELEKMHEKLFPDDIPDEWSLADQKKSHGDGPLQLHSGEKEVFDYKKFADRWYLGSSSHIWLGKKDAIAAISSCNFLTNDFWPPFADLYAERKDKWISLKEQWNLNPIKKVLTKSVYTYKAPSIEPLPKSHLEVESLPES